MTLQESDTQEFKRSFSQIDPSLKSVCTFLNHHGGVITFGRSDTGDPIGITPSDHSLRKLSQQITSRIKPEISPDIRVIEESGVHLVTVTIPEGTNKPYFLDGIAYIRVGTENRVIPPDELKRMILSTGLPPWESEICPDTTLNDIDPGLIREFLGKVSDKRLLGVNQKTPVVTVLDKLHLLKDGQITNAAALLFGKDPQRFILQSEVRCGQFRGTDVASPFINMKVIRGDLLHQIEETMTFILSNMSRSAEVKPGDTRGKNSGNILLTLSGRQLSMHSAIGTIGLQGMFRYGYFPVR
ncbi:MAG: putative DNA binding domain-containing protein [Methanospirillum sp.]|uniref:AlbA family DNA-binding domain-containing protein n=1 Tax=Methanospirillum sp. TaxID=45200 RepID=UPI002372826B|nr:RNA-binding domain-containing protein [Methanospirillum sp.]MDD1727805.1 putative DNA binding domain-containing protein [Methanospirillum sp.]